MPYRIGKIQNITPVQAKKIPIRELECKYNHLLNNLIGLNTDQGLSLPFWFNLNGFMAGH